MKGLKLDLKSLLIVLVGVLLIVYLSRDYFSMPDSKVLPACPGGSERGRNGLDCKSKGDLYGM